jgi:hypothetical protein
VRSEFPRDEFAALVHGLLEVGGVTNITLERKCQALNRICLEHKGWPASRSSEPFGTTASTFAPSYGER